MNRTMIAGMLVSTLGIWSCGETVKTSHGLMMEGGKAWSEVNNDEFKELYTYGHSWVEVQQGENTGAYFFHQAHNHEELNGSGLRVLLKQNKAWPPKGTWQIGPDAMVSYTANQTPKDGVNWVAESGSVELVPHEGTQSRSADEPLPGFTLRVNVTLVSSQNANHKKPFSGVVDEVASIACHQSQQPPVAEMQALWPPRFAQGEDPTIDIDSLSDDRPRPALCEDSALSANLKACMGYFNSAVELRRDVHGTDPGLRLLEKGDCRW